MSEAQKVVVGAKYGRLTVREPASAILSGTRKRKAWRCECDCGTWSVVLDQSLRSGRTQSCGCLSAEVVTKTRHGACAGGKQSKEYMAWRDMIQRCCNPKSRSFSNYGGRGIKVCDNWKTFEGFFADMGMCPPTHSLDRFDPDKGYFKGNCHWGTWGDQALYKRTGGTQLISYQGLTLAPSEWSKRLGIPYATILSRRAKGWPVELMLSAASFIGRNKNGKLTRN